MKFSTAASIILGLNFLTIKGINCKSCPVDVGQPNAKWLCDLWNRANVESINAKPTDYPSEEVTRAPTEEELKELFHVDDIFDEIRDREKMRQAEKQEEALRKMHMENILSMEEVMNQFHDYDEQLDYSILPFLSPAKPLYQSVPFQASMSFSDWMGTARLKDAIIIDPNQWHAN